MERGAALKNFAMVGCSVNGVPIPAVYGDYYEEDGIVLCFSLVKSESVARRLGKAACVEILKFEELKKSLDEQIGAIGRAGRCNYTDDHQRGHFLKFRSDEWQREYRVFWPADRSRTVILPGGCAKVVEFSPD